MPPISAENAAKIAEQTVTTQVVTPTTPVVTTSITESAESAETTPSVRDPSVVNNNRNLDNCKFIPKGFTQHGCVRLCMKESDVNGCNYEGCDTRCHLCEDDINCRWLLDNEIFTQNNMACEFDASNAPFRLGETERECLEACRNNRQDFGGEKCTPNACLTSCSECTDPVKCPWIIKPTLSMESLSAPGQPIISGIAGNRKLTIFWKRPFSGNLPISKYVIMAFESNNHDSGLSVQVIEEEIGRTGEKYTYTINNLSNNVQYTIGVAALNAKGMSKMSNSIELKPYVVSTGETIRDTDSIEAQTRMKIHENTQLIKDIKELMILNKKDITKKMVDDVNNKLEQQIIAKSMGEAPVHNAISYLKDKDFNIEISS